MRPERLNKSQLNGISQDKLTVTPSFTTQIDLKRKQRLQPLEVQKSSTVLEQ